MALCAPLPDAPSCWKKVCVAFCDVEAVLGKPPTLGTTGVARGATRVAQGLTTRVTIGCGTWRANGFGIDGRRGPRCAAGNGPGSIGSATGGVAVLSVWTLPPP